MKKSKQIKVLKLEKEIISRLELKNVTGGFGGSFDGSLRVFCATGSECYKAH